MVTETFFYAEGSSGLWRGCLDGFLMRCWNGDLFKVPVIDEER